MSGVSAKKISPKKFFGETAQNHSKYQANPFFPDTVTVIFHFSPPFGKRFDILGDFHYRPKRDCRHQFLRPIDRARRIIFGGKISPSRLFICAFKVGFLCDFG
jgi:hypothetical protein